MERVRGNILRLAAALSLWRRLSLATRRRAR